MERRPDDIFQVHDLSVLKSPMPVHLLNKTSLGKVSTSISSPSPLAPSDSKNSIVTPVRPKPKPPSTPLGLSSLLEMFNPIQINSPTTTKDTNATPLMSKKDFLIDPPKWSPLGASEPLLQTTGDALKARDTTPVQSGKQANHGITTTPSSSKSLSVLNKTMTATNNISRIEKEQNESTISLVCPTPIANDETTIKELSRKGPANENVDSHNVKKEKGKSGKRGKGEVKEEKEVKEVKEEKKVKKVKEEKKEKEQSADKINDQGTLKKKSLLDNKKEIEEELLKKEFTDILTSSSSSSSSASISTSKTNELIESVKVQTSNISVMSQCSTTNCVELSDWSLVIVPNNPKVTGFELAVTKEWVVLVGKRPDMNEAWHSSLITERRSPKEMVTGSGKIYKLTGSLDDSAMLEGGFSFGFVNLLRNGFPENWKRALIQEFTPLLQTSISTITIAKGLDKNLKQRGALTKTPESADKRTKSLDATPSIAIKSGKKEKSQRPNPLSRWSDNLSPLITSDNVEILGTTKSGRRIVKPLPYWENKYLYKDFSSSPSSNASANSKRRWGA